MTIGRKIVVFFHEAVSSFSFAKCSSDTGARSFGSTPKNFSALSMKARMFAEKNTRDTPVGCLLRYYRPVIRKIAYTATTALLVSCGGGSALENAVQNLPTEPTCSIDMYGDSIFYGYTLPIRGWQILSPMLPPGSKITDKTVPGLAMAQIWNGQLPWQGSPFINDTRSGTVVILEFGTNDAYWAFDIPTSLSYLNQAIKQLKAEGRGVVVASIPQWFNGYFNPTQAAAAVQWNAGAAQVAYNNGAQYVDLTSVPGDNAGNTIDGMHRTQSGLALLFSAVIPALRSACSSY